MKVVIQRVSQASVTIDEKIVAAIQNGLLVLVGIEDVDSQEDIDWLAAKVANIRIFGDENQVMNLSVKDIGGDVIVVSQFTLHANTKKGNRPSFTKSAHPDEALRLYEYFNEQLRGYDLDVEEGQFGAHMKVALENDGPVTIIFDTDHK